MSNKDHCHDSDLATLTNYTSRNPVIRLLMQNFMNRIGSQLKDIRANRLRGLDVGCGEGHLLGYLYRRGLLKHMVAVDIDESKIAYARRHYPYCEYRSGNIQALSFDDNSFDFIIATEVFEHLSDPGSALSEIRRVAKAGAPIIISVPFEPFFHWGNIVRGLYWERGGRTPDHFNFWHPHEFRRFLSTHVTLSDHFRVSTFPWLLTTGRFK